MFTLWYAVVSLKEYRNRTPKNTVVDPPPSLPEPVPAKAAVPKSLPDPGPVPSPVKPFEAPGKKESPVNPAPNPPTKYIPSPARDVPAKPSSPKPIEPPARPTPQPAPPVQRSSETKTGGQLEKNEDNKFKAGIKQNFQPVAPPPIKPNDSATFIKKEANYSSSEEEADDDEEEDDSEIERI